jgi:hypothetical protein
MSSRPARVCAAAVLGLALAGCGGGGGVALPSERPGSGLPTLSAPASESESAGSRPTLPSVTLPTRSAVVPPPTTPAPPTTTAPRTTTPPPTTTRPTTTAPPPPTIAPPTTTAPPATSPVAPTAAAPISTAPASTLTPAPTPAAEPVASSSSPPAWVWWLLGLLIAFIVATLVLVAVRGRRARKAWEARLAETVAESRWLAHELLPYALGAASAAARRDAWTAFRPRVQALVINLNAVAASASKDRMATVDRLRAAVTDVSRAMDAYAAAGPDDRESVGAARQAQRQLEEALRVLQPPPAGGPPPQR